MSLLPEQTSCRALDSLLWDQVFYFWADHSVKIFCRMRISLVGSFSWSWFPDEYVSPPARRMLAGVIWSCRRYWKLASEAREDDYCQEIERKQGNKRKRKVKNLSFGILTKILHRLQLIIYSIRYKCDQKENAKDQMRMRKRTRWGLQWHKLTKVESMCIAADWKGK